VLVKAIDVDVVRGLRSTAVVYEDDDRLFVAVSRKIGVLHRLKREPFVLAVFFAVHHYARSFRESGPISKMDRPSVGGRVRRRIKPFKASVTEQVSAQGIGEVFEVHLPDAL